MKIFLMSLVLMVSMGCSAVNEAPGDHIGAISATKLLADYPEFQASYNEFEPSNSDLKAMKSLEGKSIVVLFGTWCHDSEREVPRLLKLLDSSSVTLDNLQLVAVDRSKQEPGNRHSEFALKYTPTIILLDSGKEIGRVIERPKISLAEDLAEFSAL
ncbi:thioredoxin [Paraglaciecola sp. 2405UD69-4]|uniref:thioredoxin n=1 Tax=Paraglaciecola sp. 2405UD69-4 TaxID=3391836 RepID=UPI0039C91687